MLHGTKRLALDLCYVILFCVMGGSHMIDCLIPHSTCSLIVDLSQQMLRQVVIICPKAETHLTRLDQPQNPPQLLSLQLSC